MLIKWSHSIRTAFLCMYVVTDFEDAANTQQTNIIKMPTRTEKTECNRCKVTNANVCVYMSASDRTIAEKNTDILKNAHIWKLEYRRQRRDKKSRMKNGSTDDYNGRMVLTFDNKRNRFVFSITLFLFFILFIYSKTQKIAYILSLDEWYELNMKFASSFKLEYFQYSFPTEFILSELN